MASAASRIRPAVIVGALALLGEQRARRTEPPTDAGARPIAASGHRVACRRHGSGPVTVVVCAGAGDCAASWEPVAEQVGVFAEVVRFDRPGVGDSGAGPRPSLSGYLADLDAVVDATASRRPLVLVGQSLGGLIARMYTLKHPDRVAGLVLLDATPEAVAGDPGVKVGFFVSGVAASLLRAFAPFGILTALLRWNAFPLYPEQDQYRAATTPEQYARWKASVRRTFAGPAAGRELRSVLPAAAEAETVIDGLPAPVLGGVPLYVLGSCAWGAKWEEMQRELATRSSHGSFRPTGDTSHNIHMSHVDVTVEAIRDAVAAALAATGARSASGHLSATP